MTAKSGKNSNRWEGKSVLVSDFFCLLSPTEPPLSQLLVCFVVIDIIIGIIVNYHMLCEGKYFRLSRYCVLKEHVRWGGGQMLNVYTCFSHSDLSY